jgi:hypothetical protein
MDRLAEQVVAWHNRHPLAKRITIYDVHTMGLVALPFMRSGGGDTPIEPVLTDEVSPDSLTAAWDAVADPDVIDQTSAAQGTADSPAAADEAEAPQKASDVKEPPIEAGLDEETRPANHEQRSASAAPAAPAPRWWQRLNPLGWRAAGKRADAMHWPVFSERFIPNLSPRRVSAFALQYGYANPPRGPEWPQRVVSIDDDLLERGASGSWPYEIYLMSAGIDAGKSRSRVLVGIGPNRQSAFLGRRCWSFVRVGLLALVLAGLALAATAMFKPHGASDEHGAADAAASAASAATPASAPASVPSAPTPLAASEPAAAASAELPASAASAASAPEAAASSAGEPPALPAVSAPAAQAVIPNIRPQLSQQLKPALPGASKPTIGTAAAAAASKATEDDHKTKATPAMPESKAEKPATASPKTSLPAAEPVRRKAAATPAEELASPRIQPGDLPAGAQTPSADGKRVALVGPGSANKADAEAMLARMLAHVQQTMGRDAPVQAQVFKSPEGWRPAIWPFVSREQAQLVNATLIARGVRAKAIDF